MKAIVANRHLITRIANAARGKTYGGQGGSVQEVPIPSITESEILVKVNAVALNPTDHKHLDVISPPGSIIGCDYAGTVHKVGGPAAAQRWKVGDRVAGAVHGGLYPDRGAFAEYLKIDADLAWRVPDPVSDADAATYGVSAVTAMLALNARLGLPWLEPGKTNAPSGKTILIYAGSTSSGLLQIQVAKAAGYKVVTTASPHSYDLVMSYGADATFNYRSPTVAAEIAKAHPDITLAVDCFSEGKSSEVCAEVIGKKGGKVVQLLPNGKSKVQGVEFVPILAYTLFGRPFQWLPPIGPKFEAIPDDRKALARFYGSLPQLLGDIRPPPVTLRDGGFEAVLEGLSQLREGKVSGGKLVVKL